MDTKLNNIRNNTNSLQFNFHTLSITPGTVWKTLTFGYAFNTKILGAVSDNCYDVYHAFRMKDLTKSNLLYRFTKTADASSSASIFRILAYGY